MNELRKNIIDIYENTVEKYGDREAAMDPNSSITWKEYRSRARQGANVLLDRLMPETAADANWLETYEVGYPIAIFSEKKVELLISVMSCIYVGAFYTYINPEQPAERIAKILSVLNPKLVIVDEEFREKLAAAGYTGDTIDMYQVAGGASASDLSGKVSTQTSNLEMSGSQSETARLDAVVEMIDRETPLYGVFTSGSTGTPKCILINHGAVMDFIGHFSEVFDFDETDVIGNQAPFDFDVSVKDIYTSIFTGAKMVLIPREYFSTPPILLDYLCDNHVTNLTWAVSALCIISGLKGFSYRVPTDIRRVMFSGEVMPMKQLALWQENVSNARYVNLYGPSEITCNCTYFQLDRKYDKNEKLPLGKPFPGRSIYLLDENGQVITEANKPGEICVTGESIAVGYFNNPEQTSLHFVTFTNPQGGSERMYKTGDMAYIADDGQMYFAGRKDFQIKHMGHRIELEEIEGGINNMPDVSRSICVYDENRHRISAYYTGDVDKKTLHLQLKEALPVYMVPNKFIHVSEFILNKNGKIDRKRLDELEVIE